MEEEESHLHKVVLKGQMVIFRIFLDLGCEQTKQLIGLLDCRTYNILKIENLTLE